MAATSLLAGVLALSTSLVARARPRAETTPHSARVLTDGPRDPIYNGASGKAVSRKMAAADSCPAMSAPPRRSPLPFPPRSLGSVSACDDSGALTVTESVGMDEHGEGGGRDKLRWRGGDELLLVTRLS